MNTCKGCGNKIIWGLTSSGKKIPLDTSAPVYLLAADPKETKEPIPVRRIRQFFVSHFSTCPKANDFSANNKNKEEQNVSRTRT